MVTALLAVGCGLGSHKPQITVTHEKASTGPGIVGRSLMTRTHLLERVAEHLARGNTPR